VGKHEKWYPIQGADHHRVNVHGEIKNTITNNKLKGRLNENGERVYRFHNNYDDFRIIEMTGKEALMGVRQMGRKGNTH